MLVPHKCSTTNHTQKHFILICHPWASTLIHIEWISHWRSFSNATENIEKKCKWKFMYIYGSLVHPGTTCHWWVIFPHKIVALIWMSSDDMHLANFIISNLICQYLSVLYPSEIIPLKSLGKKKLHAMLIRNFPIFSCSCVMQLMLLPVLSAQAVLWLHTFPGMLCHHLSEPHVSEQMACCKILVAQPVALYTWVSLADGEAMPLNLLWSFALRSINYTGDITFFLYMKPQALGESLTWCSLELSHNSLTPVGDQSPLANHPSFPCHHVVPWENTLILIAHWRCC